MTDYAAVQATLGINAAASVATPVLTINGPATVVEDTPADFWGVLNGGSSKAFVPLPGQTITISVDGVAIGTVQTVMSGTEAVWAMSITFGVKGAHTVMARFAGATVAD